MPEHVPSGVTPSADANARDTDEGLALDLMRHLEAPHGLSAGEARHMWWTVARFVEDAVRCCEGGEPAPPYGRVVLALCGPSPSGKTTLRRLIVALLETRRGRPVPITVQHAFDDTSPMSSADVISCGADAGAGTACVTYSIVLRGRVRHEDSVPGNVMDARIAQCRVALHDLLCRVHLQRGTRSATCVAQHA